MKMIHMRSRVGADGILTLNVPTEAPNTELDVTVVVAPANSTAQSSNADWESFVRSTAGSIPGSDLERHPQGEYETRDSIA